MTVVPASEIARTRRGPMRSLRVPPIGRASTAAIAKPAVRVPAAVRSKE
jgi:hypothetical protein